MERRLILPMLVLAALALLTQTLVWLLVPAEQAPAFVGPPRSDYTLSDFTLNALDAQGHPAFRIAAPFLQRKAEDGSIYVTAPDYEIVDNAHNVWKGSSESAWVNRDGSVMKLEGTVHMHRVASANVSPVRLQTSDLTVVSTPDAHAAAPHARDRKMHTAAPTTIASPDHVVRGVGMNADLGLKTVELLSDVHWISQPPAHASKHR